MQYIIITKKVGRWLDNSLAPARLGSARHALACWLLAAGCCYVQLLALYLLPGRCAYLDGS